MRYYRSVGIAVIATAIIVFGVARCAEAAELPRCVPVDEVAHDLVAAEIQPSELSKLVGNELTMKYIEDANIEVPDPNDPIGVFFVTQKDFVLANFIEREGCVRWAAKVPQKQHEDAMNKLAAEI